MRTICDYAVPQNLPDGEQTTSMEVPVSQRNIKYNFTLPAGTQSGSRAILSFMLRTVDPDNLQFQFEIGGHTKTYTVNTDVRRAFHEIIGPNALNVARLDENSVTFKPVGGDGLLVISDVVLWFQRAS